MSHSKHIHCIKVFGVLLQFWSVWSVVWERTPRNVSSCILFPETKEFVKSCSIALAYNSYNLFYYCYYTKYTAISSIMLCPYYTPEKVCWEGIALLPSFPHCIKTVFAVNISKASVLNLIAVAFTMGSSERMIFYWLLCWIPAAASKAPLVKGMERINCCSLGFHFRKQCSFFYTPD